MKSSYRFCSKLVFGFLLLFLLPIATQAVSVDVSFNADGQERVNEPVTFGVPIAQSEDMLTLDNISVRDVDGNAIDAQFEITARWGGAPDDATKPIRWILIDTQVSAQSNETVVYTISNTADSHTVSGGIQVTDDPTTYTINTGAATFVLDKEQFNGFKTVTLSDSTVLIDNTLTDGIQVTDTDSNVYHASSYDISELTQPDLQTEYEADNTYSYPGYGFGSEIVRQGSERVRIRYHGQFTENFSDETNLEEDDLESVLANSYAPYNSNEITGTDEIEYTLDVDFFADQSYVKVYLTIENNNSCLIDGAAGWTCQNHSTLNSIRFDDVSWMLSPEFVTANLNYQLSGSTTTHSGIASTDQDIKLYQGSSGTSNWDYYTGDTNNARRMNYNVEYPGYRYTIDDIEQSNDGGTQALGWLSADDGEHGVAVGMRDFWQNFPGSLELDNASGEPTLRAGLFAEEFAADHTLRAGEHKTHEMAFYFYNSITDAAPSSVMKEFHQPLIPVLPSKYYKDSYALGYVVPFEGTDGDTNYDDWSDYQVYNAASLDTNVSTFYKYNPGDVWSMLTLVPDYEYYGWQTYGFIPTDYEQHTGTDGYKYSFLDGIFAQFAGTASEHFTYGKLWHEQARIGTRALTDICFLHQPYHYYTSLQRGGCIQHEQHETAQLDGFYRELGAPVTDLAFNIGGFSYAYFMYDDPRAYRSGVEYVNFLRYRWDERNEFGSFNGNPPGREHASTLRQFVEAYQLTGEEKYFDEATELVMSDDMINREGWYLTCASPGACTQEEMDAFTATFSDGFNDLINHPIIFHRELMLPSLGIYLDVAKQRGEEDSEHFLRAKELLDDRANFLTTYVMKSMNDTELLAELNQPNESITGQHLLNDAIDEYYYFPYFYWLNGEGGTIIDVDYTNEDPNIGALHIFAVAGLAYAYKYTANDSYLTAAGNLYETIAEYPFSIDWDTRTYSQIKEAGKWAEYARYYEGILVEGAVDEVPPEEDDDPTDDPEDPGDPGDTDPPPTDDDPTDEVDTTDDVVVTVSKYGKYLYVRDADTDRLVFTKQVRKKRQDRVRMQTNDFYTDGKTEIVLATQRKGTVRVTLYRLTVSNAIKEKSEQTLDYSKGFTLYLTNKRVSLRKKDRVIQRYKVTQKYKLKPL